jgi:hypothetical protein
MDGVVARLFTLKLIVDSWYVSGLETASATNIPWVMQSASNNSKDAGKESILKLVLDFFLF